MLFHVSMQDVLAGLLALPLFVSSHGVMALQDIFSCHI